MARVNLLERETPFSVDVPLSVEGLLSGRLLPETGKRGNVGFGRVAVLARQNLHDHSLQHT